MLLEMRLMRLLERLLLAISAVRGILCRILTNTTIMGATRGATRGGKVSVGVLGSVIGVIGSATWHGREPLSGRQL
jgi:uncharacterized membrane protein